MGHGPAVLAAVAGWNFFFFFFFGGGGGGGEGICLTLTGFCREMKRCNFHF